MLAVFCESYKSSLRYLRVVVDSTEPCTHAITALAWSQFCQSCSNAKVGFHFLGKLGFEEYQRVFVKYIPMNEIDILSWNRYFNDRQPLREDIPHILTHVGVTYPQIGERLVTHGGTHQDILTKSRITIIGIYLSPYASLREYIYTLAHYIKYNILYGDRSRK